MWRKRAAVFCCVSWLFGSATAADTRAADWPNNYGWRVATLGGTYLAVPDETTNLNLFNLENPAGLAFLPPMNRFDLSAGLEFPTVGGHRDYEYLFEENGPYAGFTFWFDKTEMSTAMQIVPVTLATKPLENVAIALRLLSLNTNQFRGLVGLGWQEGDPLQPGSGWTLGIYAGAKNPVSYFMEDRISTGIGYHDLFTVNAQALYCDDQWQIGFLLGYEQYTTIITYFSNVSEPYSYEKNIDFTPIVRKRIALSEDADLWLGLRYSTDGSGWISTPWGYGRLLLRQEVGLGVGLEALDGALSTTLQAGFLDLREIDIFQFRYDRRQLGGGLEIRFSDSWAFRAGYQAVLTQPQDTVEQTTSVGVGWQVQEGFAIDLIGRHNMQGNYFQDQLVCWEEAVSVLLGFFVDLG